MDEWDEPQRTIYVIEGADHRYSSVLDKNGQPFLFERQLKIGFDLTPKKNNDNEKIDKI